MDFILSSLFVGYSAVSGLLLLYLLLVFQRATKNLTPVASIFYIFGSLFFAVFWFPALVVLMLKNKELYL